MGEFFVKDKGCFGPQLGPRNDVGQMVTGAKGCFGSLSGPRNDVGQLAKQDFKL